MRTIVLVGFKGAGTVCVPEGTTVRHLLQMAGLPNALLKNARADALDPDADLHEVAVEGQELWVTVPISLDAQRSKYRGARINELIQRHVRRATAGQLLQEYAGLENTFLKRVPKAALDAIRVKWGGELGSERFWRQDCAEVFDRIIDDARATFREAGIAFDDDTLFDTFHWVVMGYATLAAIDKSTRERMGIRKGLFSR